MKKEEQLSDFKQVMRISGKAVVVYPEEDVKEFIKRLKEYCDYREGLEINRISGENVKEEIDKLAGDDLK